MEINAQIESTMLGIEDHGIMTFFLHLKFNSCGQGFGGYSLRGEKSIYAVRAVLEVVGVSRWEDLKGKYVRIRKDDLYGGDILAIGHIIEDRWFSLKDHFAEN